MSHLPYTGALHCVRCGVTVPDEPDTWVPVGMVEAIPLEEAVCFFCRSREKMGDKP